MSHPYCSHARSFSVRMQSFLARDGRDGPDADLPPGSTPGFTMWSQSDGSLVRRTGPSSPGEIRSQHSAEKRVVHHDAAAEVPAVALQTSITGLN